MGYWAYPGKALAEANGFYGLHGQPIAVDIADGGERVHLCRWHIVFHDA